MVQKDIEINNGFIAKVLFLKKQTMQLRRNTEEQQNTMNPSKLCGNLFLKMNVKKKVHTVC